MYGSVFQEFSGLHFGGECFRRQEMVVYAILFTGTRGARGAGNGVACEPCGLSAAAERCFAGTGWPGYNKQCSNHIVLLFYVLNLFANFLQFSLGCHDNLSQACIICFGSGGVELAENFLAHEVERAPHGLLLIANVGKLL